MFLPNTPFSREEMLEAALRVANIFRHQLDMPKLDTLVGRCGKDFRSCGIAHAVNHGIPGAPYFVMNNTTIESKRIVTLQQGNPDAPFDKQNILHTVEDDAAWWFIQNYDYRKFPELQEEYPQQAGAAA